MNIIISILQRVLVNHFYKVNAGLFLFLFFVLFGMPYQPLYFHLSLVTGIVQSQVFLGLVLGLWVLYNLKCIDYLTTQLKEPKLLFLSCMNNLSYKEKFWYMCYVQATVYMPVLIYSVAIIIVSVDKRTYLPVVEIVAFNATLIAVTAQVYVATLDRKVLLPSLKLTGLAPAFAKPLFLIPLLHLWYKRKQMLLITKTFSLLVLWGFITLYEPAQYDIRPLLLCLLLCIGAHTAIIYQLRVFEEEYLGFTKNLPILLVKRFAAVALSFTVLILPEFLFVSKGYGVHFSTIDFPHIVVFTIGLLCLFYTTLVIEETTMDQFMRLVFWITAGCFFILLYNPGLLFAFAVLLLSYALYASYYYHYEKKIA